MIVTEEEAKTKWCQESTPTSGRFTEKCLGSGCMSWRWFDNTDDQAIKQPRGYCGKAGKP